MKFVDYLFGTLCLAIVIVCIVAMVIASWEVVLSLPWILLVTIALALSYSYSRGRYRR